MTEQEQKEALLTEIKNKVSTELDTRGFTKKDDVEALVNSKLEGMDLEGLRAYKADKEALELSVRNMATELQKLKDAGISAETKQIRSVAEQLKEQAEGERAEEWKQFKAGQLRNFKFQVRAALPVMTASGAGTSGNAVVGAGVYQPYYMPGVSEPNRKVPFILDYATQFNPTSPVVVYTEKYNKQGQAQFLGEGELKPLISWQYRTKTETPKKVAARTKVSTELLKDYAQMENEINTELRYEVDIETNAKLLTGNTSTNEDEPNGIETVVGGYVLTYFNGKIPNANNFDVVKVVAAQIRNMRYLPTHLFLNDLVAAEMDLSKDANGQYILPPFSTTNGQVISGVIVVPTPDLATGEAIMGDMNRFNVAMWEEFEVTAGWENDDFSKNLVTFVGERRLFAFIKSQHTGAFVKFDFATVKALITAA